MSDQKVMLIILDGYGHSDLLEHNAIYQARKPNMDSFEKDFPHTLLETSGVAVGLPPGVMGNSEVGHLNLGAGRVIKQEFTKIADFAKTKGFESLPDVKRVLTEGQGDLHILGLLSDGGVHSHLEHIFLFLSAAQRMKCQKKIYIHVITDGRDTPPKSAHHFVSELETQMKKTGYGQVATLCGRFYAMDRDKRWERVKLAYDMYTGIHCDKNAENATQAIAQAYDRGETDEFILPTVIQGGKTIGSDDSIIFINFRADRAREICQALAIKSFSEFPTPIKVREENLVTMTQYEGSFPFPVLFKQEKYKNLLGEIVAAKGESQLRIAETEKYAHVTYFFNGGNEAPFQGEERILVPSPKDVATYDLKPEMAAEKLTVELLNAVLKRDFKLIVLNFANGDMVGHTGVENAAVRAIEVLDQCLGKISNALLSKGYDILITADHGNSECMLDPVTHEPHTAHTTNPVPLIWLSQKNKNRKLKSGGVLADIAPTILDIWGWQKPPEMTGQSLLTN